MVKLRKRLLVAALSLTAATSGAMGATMLSVSGAADETAKEVNPLAKYEFKDTANIGKDSMGKYDLTFRNEWKAGGTGPLLNEYTAIEGGGITFNNKLCLAADKDKNVFKDTSAVTMVMSVKMVSGSKNWGHIAGVGFANAKSTGLSAHSAADGANHVRIASKGIAGLGSRAVKSAYGTTASCFPKRKTFPLPGRRTTKTICSLSAANSTARRHTPPRLR